MLQTQNISLQYGGRFLFDEIGFMINARDRIGLVGRNGTGKSTLLRILLGDVRPDQGEVITPNEYHIGYLPQEVHFTSTQTVIDETKEAFNEINILEEELETINKQLENYEQFDPDDYAKILESQQTVISRLQFLGADTREGDMEKVLMGLGFQREDFVKQTSQLSGGWQMRIELAKLLLQNPNLLLLDEPTNHLDIESVQWLESFLKNYEGAIVLVSHDRQFLDSVTNRTFELSLGKMYDYKANYSKYVQLQKERIEKQKAASKNQERVVKQMERNIDRFRAKANKAKFAQSLIKKLDKLERIEVDEQDIKAMRLRFPEAPRSGKIVLEAKGIGKSFGDHEVLRDLNFTIAKGERIAFVGKNGEGKTTLTRIIKNELDFTGVSKLGHNVSIGYYAQHQADMLDGSRTVFELIDGSARGEMRTKVRGLLGAFLFTGEDVDKKVKVLSGGEKSRLALAKLLLDPVNLLILDEPTNHLDMLSKDVLKEALLQFGGTLIVVSHDREFLDGLVTKVYEFKNRGITEHLGGVYDYITAWKKTRELELKEDRPTTKKKLSDHQLSYQEKKNLEKSIRKLERQLGNTENTITKMEAELKLLEEELAKPEVMSDSNNLQKLIQAYDEKKTSLDQKMMDWEKTSKELEHKKTLLTDTRIN